MSAFLGPIHFWLYNKIEVEENILKEIIDKANDKSDISSIVNEGVEKFGKAVSGELEDNIDQDNIHGWLQGKIASVESRVAFTVTYLLNNDVLTFEEINDVFIESAKECASKISSANSSSKIYEQIYNYLLAGMPCDRVNEVIENGDDFIKWQTAIDIHKQYWDIVDGDVNNFHKFIDSWIKSFVATVNSDYNYVKNGNENIIERI